MNARPDLLRELTRQFLPDLRRHRRLLAVSYACRVLAVGGAMLAPWPLKLIIDYALPGDTSVTLFSRETLVVLLTAGFFAATALYALAGAAEKNLSALVRERLTLELRDRILAHLLTLSPLMRTKHRSGELVLRILDDTDLFVRVLTKTLPQIFQQIVTVVASLALMLWISPMAAVAGAAWLPLVALVLRRDGGRLWRASREKRSREGHVSALAQEIVRAVPFIQASASGDLTRDAFRKLNAARLTAGREETAVAVSLERSLQLVQGLALGVVTGGGAWLALRGQLTVGDLTLLGAYVVQLFKPLEKLNDLAETTGRGLASGDRLLALLDQAALVVDSADATDVSASRGVLEIDDVSFAYPERRRSVLSGVSFRLEPRTLTVLVGRSGAGKSTLLSLLLRGIDPDEGSIRLDGRNIRSLRLRSYREQFAILWQDTHIFAGTIRSALLSSGRRADDRELWHALSLVSLDGLVRHLPRRLDEPLGEDGLNLSAGQRRRLALARAFLLRRPIVLLDEPLANIDAESASVVLRAIAQLARRATCLAVTHDSALVAQADRVLHVDNGHVTERTAPTLVAAAFGRNR
jgi:ATP-binding cassette subfamily B protein